MNHSIIDVWVLIFDEIVLYKDAFNLSKVCRNARTAFFMSIQTPIYDKFAFPIRTFINYAVCSTCDKTSLVTTSFMYNYDEYPRRILICCDKWECMRSCLNKFFEDANQARINPFLRFSQDILWVPRSQSGFSVGKPCNYVIVDNDRYMVKVIFEEKRYISDLKDPIQTEEFSAFKHIYVSQLKQFTIHNENMFYRLLKKCYIHPS